ncbi:enoyl-CoA hydratase-related protein [Gordonia soli]|uniref:Enoyl-CoA hydratase/isomerase family protein n=1 Tax=Gordonia soli NBRC 108243 TaxID=1223545 RepID=M0QI53_9ACTN|nr:enoyl-CoA hydratase-related protein [Gordonia soli]GAC67107.1 enoyl-CoA hydratase/isomerase family protein [Gordonia soli NBRC 108243]
MPHLIRDDDVYVLHLDDADGDGTGENVIGPPAVRQIGELLDEVAAADGASGLVTTGAGKFFSTGLDTAWVLQNVEQVDAYTQSVQELLARFLSFPMPTAAAINGHAFGAGALLAFAHDRIVMRADRGFLCMPGVTIGASYAPGSVRLVAAKVPAPINHEVLVTGRRYGGAVATELGIVHEAVAQDEVVPAATKWVREHGHLSGRTIGEIKASLHADVVDALRAEVSGVGDQAAIADS